MAEQRIEAQRIEDSRIVEQKMVEKRMAEQRIKKYKEQWSREEQRNREVQSAFNEFGVELLCVFKCIADARNSHRNLVKSYCFDYFLGGPPATIQSGILVFFRFCRYNCLGSTDVEFSVVHLKLHSSGHGVNHSKGNPQSPRASRGWKFQKKGTIGTKIYLWNVCKATGQRDAATIF